MLFLNGMLFKEDGDGSLADLSFSYAYDEIDELILLGVDVDLIRIEECKRGRQGGAFVAVDERMVAANAMKVRGCHLEDRFVKEDPSKG